MAWQDDLQPASWRKIPFFVDGSDGVFGRNTAVHAYPFVEKNQTWVEDLGLGPPRIRITGFLLGDDVRDQHLKFFKAMVLPGPGELVHPIYGSQRGSIVGQCAFRARRDRGRYVELVFEFVAHNDKPYPTAAAKTDTQNYSRERAAQSRGAAASTYQERTGQAAPSALQATSTASAADVPAATAATTSTPSAATTSTASTATTSAPSTASATAPTTASAAGTTLGTTAAPAPAVVPTASPAVVPTPIPAVVPGAQPASVPAPWSAETSRPPTITVVQPEQQIDSPPVTLGPGALTS